MRQRAHQELAAFAADEVATPVHIAILASATPVDVITRHAARNA
jgi:hypothetical protein